MEIVYSYYIQKIECKPEYNGLENVVYRVLWTLTGASEGFTQTLNREDFVSAPSGEDFTPFDQLTESQVMGWIESVLGEEGMQTCKDYVYQHLYKTINPDVIDIGLPWKQTQEDI